MCNLISQPPSDGAHDRQSIHWPDPKVSDILFLNEVDYHRYHMAPFLSLGIHR